MFYLKKTACLSRPTIRRRRLNLDNALATIRPPYKYLGNGLDDGLDDGFDSCVYKSNEVVYTTPPAREKPLMLQSVDSVTLHYLGNNEAMESHQETLYDGRQALAQLDFSEVGFTLQRHRSNITNWLDEEAINRDHKREIMQLALQFSHCDAVVGYPAIIRGPAEAVRHEDHLPIQIAHSDFTDDYRPMILNPSRPYSAFLEPHLRDAGINYKDLNAAKRLLMLQFWRNTGPVNPDFPLAIADARSVPHHALQRRTVTDYAGETLAFETFFLKPPDRKRPYQWYTFPNMTHEEVLIFRTYDSRQEEAGLPYWTPHSAYSNPDKSSATQFRNSVEMRVLCIFY